MRDHMVAGGAGHYFLAGSLNGGPKGEKGRREEHGKRRLSPAPSNCLKIARRVSLAFSFFGDNFMIQNF